MTLNDVTAGKPAPDLFLLAAERMGVPRHECIVYEDSDAGLDANSIEEPQQLTPEE